MLQDMYDQVLQTVKVLLQKVVEPPQSIYINVDARNVTHDKTNELVATLEKTATSLQENNIKLVSRNKILEEKITTVEKCCEDIASAFATIDNQADMQKQLDDKLKKWNQVLEDSESLSKELE